MEYWLEVGQMVCRKKMEKGERAMKFYKGLLWGLFFSFIIWGVLIAVVSAEEYTKVDDNTLKVSNLEAYLPVNGKQVKATIAEVDFTYEQLQQQAKAAQAQYDNFKARADRHLADMQKDIDTTKARLEQATTLAIVAKPKEIKNGFPK